MIVRKCRLAHAQNTAERERKLIDLLGGIAGYNDKGCQWLKHDEKKIAQTREQFGAELENLLLEFDKKFLSKKALELFNSSLVTGDRQGLYRETAITLLDTDSFYESIQKA